jgi:hypothetical protein
MRRLLIGSLVFLACEARPPVAPSAPKVDGVEGHGGIAVTEPRAQAALPVVAPTPPGATAPTVAGENPLRVRDLYLQGYQLKDSDPKAAAALFRQVVALTPKGSHDHEKARSRLVELGEAPPP